MIKQQSNILQSRINKYVERYIIDKCRDYYAYIAGGCITSICTDTIPNDIDIFFKTDILFENLNNSLKSTSICLSETKNAITYQYYGNTVQLIKPNTMFGLPEKLIERFDFTISMGAYDPIDNTFYFNDRFFIDLIAKKLVYNPDSIRPISTLNRLQKFLSRGYSISGIELIKIALAINSRQINDKIDLANEILGIDSIFLKSYIEELEKGGEFKYEEEQERLDKYRNNV